MLRFLKSLKQQAVAIGIGIVDAFTIDKINIYEASGNEAIELLPEQPTIY